MDSLNTANELVAALRARLPGVHLRTLEEERAENAIKAAVHGTAIAGATKSLWFWSVSSGLRDVPKETDKDPVTKKEPCGFDEAITDFIAFKGNLVLCLFDPWDELSRAIFQSFMKKGLRHARGSGKCLIVVGREWRIPEELRDAVQIIDLPLPTKDELARYINELADDYKTKMGDKIKISKEAFPDLARACSGLTADETKSIMALALVRFRAIGRDTVSMAIKEKKQIVSRTGILEYEEPTRGMDDVGGLQDLKRWAALRKRLFTDEARKAGINAPKGVLLLGLPGTGKSLCAKAIASAWSVPLVRLDAGRLFGSLVGESESNLRSALRTAEAVAPCVMMIDELEKAFSNGPGGDGGTSQRVFGALLTWLQDKKADVFVVATANNIEKLPPELLRKGRFDEIFFVDLPDTESREEIIRIHLGAAGHKFACEKAVDASVGYTGAELEAAVQSALIQAFAEKERKPTPTDVLEAIRETVPLSKTMQAQVDALRKWAQEGRARFAGGTIEKEARAKAKAGTTPDLGE